MLGKQSAQGDEPVGFTKEQLESYRGVTVPDLIGEDCRLLFVGINPGLWTAATQTHFCHPSNRFYPALKKAALIDWDVDTNAGLTAGQRLDIIGKGLGISNLVSRATARASELDASELRDGGKQLQALIGTVEPRVVAVAGITAFRTAFRSPKASLGRQETTMGGSEVWAVPNPSGLNAHETVESLAVWYRRVSVEAGVL